MGVKPSTTRHECEAGMVGVKRHRKWHERSGWLSVQRIGGLTERSMRND